MFGLYSDFLIISSILYSPLGEMVLVARERERERETFGMRQRVWRVLYMLGGIIFSY